MKMWQIKQSVSCTAYGSSLNVQFCERSKKKIVKQTIMWGRTRVRDKERARESKSVHARLPLGMSEKLWVVCQWIRKAHANTHTHTPHWARASARDRSIEGTGRELSLSVELMKPGSPNIKEWRELALRSYTHSLTSFLYTSPDEVMLSLLKGYHK